MKKQIFLACAILLTVLTGCIEYDRSKVSKDFPIDESYSGLRVSSAISVTVSDTADKITVTAPESIMPRVEVEMDGGTLKMRLKPRRPFFRFFVFRLTSDIEVVIPYNPELTYVHLSGASDFHTDYGIGGNSVKVELSGSSDFFGEITAETIDLDLSGSSDIEAQVSATDLVMNLSGASDADLTGSVKNLRMALSGSSDLIEKVSHHQYGLSCEQCKVSLSGASDAFIHCDGTISGSLSGASTLLYTGNATATGLSVSGGSEIIQKAL